MLTLISGGTLLFWLLVGHALCDFPLQGDFLARAKNHRNPIAGISPTICLFAHCLIQAGMVAYVTGRIWLGLLEFSAHAITDWAKCDEQITFAQDQAIHIACKLVWAIIWVNLSV